MRTSIRGFIAKAAGVGVAVALLALPGERARAQEAAPASGGAASGGAGAGAETSAPKVKVERSATGQKIYRITEGIVVEGKIQKPNAFYVLQRSSLDYDWESLKQDFLPRILQATTRHPF